MRRLDAALADDWNTACAALLVHLVNFQERDRPDRRARQPALNVADDRQAPLDVDRHAHQRIDHRERIVPASMQARALAAMSVWFGESFVMSGFLVTLRHAATTRADMSG